MTSAILPNGAEPRAPLGCSDISNNLTSSIGGSIPE